MKTEASSGLNAEQYARLKRLSDLGDKGIDFSDAPEVTDWTGAKRGMFYAGPEDKITVGLDSDVVNWFQTQSPDTEESESSINKALRSYIAEQKKKAG